MLQLRKKVFLFYAFVYPGVILHELGHFIGCKLTGARVCSVKLVSKTGGEVIHEKSKLPIVGNFIISIFPLILALALQYFIVFVYFDYKFSSNQVIEIIFKAIGYYFLIATLLTMFPSIEDIKNALILYLFFVFGVILIIVKTNWSVPQFLNSTLWFCAILLIVVNLTLMVLLNINYRRI